MAELSGQELAGKVAIVTGGGTGIGRACSLAFARHGARVAVNYSRSHEDAEQTAKECHAAGGEGVAVQADISKLDEIEKLVAATVEKWGRIDVLVNNAGTTVFAAYDNLDAMTDEVWDRILATNLKGVFFASRAVAPHMMRQRSGLVVKIGSVVSMLATPFGGAYSGMTQSTQGFARCGLL